MTILRASKKDLEQIYTLTKSCALDMIGKGIFQWNEHYPSREVLGKDIQLQQIWKLVENKGIVGIIVLTENEDDVYKNVNWITPNDRNIYVHRFAIDPGCQGKGYGQKLMDFSEDFCRENKYNSIRLDTFSQNKRNQKFYEKRNYVKLGPIYLPDQSKDPFYCYEKVLNA